MDRREALKKIGIGGAVAVGTTAVLSSPAFAYTTATVTGTPSTFSCTTATKSTATAAASGFPNGQCPASSTNAGDTPTQGTLTYAWSVDRTDGTNLNSGSGTAISRGSGTWDSSGQTTDTITVTIKRKYTCTYGTGSAVRCVQWVRVFSAPVSGSAWGTVSTSGPTTSTGCA